VRVATDVRGAALLALVAMLWGTTFVVVKGATASLDPSVIVLGRFVVAALLFLPFLERDRALLVAGLELGGWLWLGYATQAVGLVDTSASRSAFITALNVVLVPLLAVLGGRRIGASAWLSAPIALAGVAILSYDGAPPNRGDLVTLLTAVTYAGYILRLEAYAPRFGARALTAAQIVGVLPFALVAVLVAARGGTVAPGAGEPGAWLAVLYLGVVTTALTTWMQTIGQRLVASPQAAVLYASEPVWAALCAGVVLHERFGPRGWAGAVLVVGAIALGQVPDGRRPGSSVRDGPVTGAARSRRRTP
jgi:drug/metabolite transporter (DMT)-like permease